ncbi:MAG: hypothetical protein MAG451_01449 [Anaerolineales bacterium]|nr:hypothetical protein [Anaerolineales bacterium]
MAENETQDQAPAGRRHDAVAIPEYVYPYRSGIVGGLIGGAVMALVGALSAPLIQHSVWFPLNLVAAAVMPLQKSGLDQFMLDTFIVGLVIHIAMSVLFGLLFALLLPTLPGHPLVWSVVIGAIMWFVALRLALPILNRLMAEYIQPVSFIVAHVGYTLTLGWWVSRYEKVKVGGN